MSEAQAVAAGPSRAAGSKPWLQTAIAALPVAPALVGVGIALGLLGLCVIYSLLAGFLSPGGILEPEFWREVGGPVAVMATLIGYAPAATAYSQRASLRALRALRPVLPADERFSAIAERVTGFDLRALRVAGALSVPAVIPFILFDPSMQDLRANPQPAQVLWIFAINALLFASITRMLVHELRVSHAFSRVGEELARVDLLDLRPLEPFTRRGLQGALVWILSVSILSLHFLVGSAAEGMPIVLGVMVGVAALALLLPVRGVHRRLAREKRTALERLDAGIRPLREVVLAGGPPAPDAPAARLAALLTLRAHVASAREWPFDVPTLFRFGLYVAIGLGSWLGGALVERLLDAVLG